MNNEIDAKAKSTHEETEEICSRTNLPDISAHMSDLETAMSGLEYLITELDRKVDEAKYERDSRKNMKRVLERDFERCRRSYWSLKQEGDRSLPKRT